MLNILCKEITSDKVTSFICGGQMMKAFIVNVSQLFSLDTQNSEESNFSADKRKLLIPLYQREYKWEDKNIQSIVNDIKNHEKFLGNIILDEANDCYEIVDGQQRITTCFLLLLSIHKVV